MDSEIAQLYKNLSIADEDGAIHEMSEEAQRDGVVDVNHCLVGKVLSGKKVNREAFKGLIEHLWNQFRTVEIESVGENILMFFFSNQEDRNRIWQRGPWYFDKSLIALEKLTSMREISLLGFNKVELWVQIHDVLIMCMNKKIAKWLAEQIGEMVEIPTESKECWEFCYACGKIGHVIKECLDVEARTEALTGMTTKFGSWMRAPFMDKRKIRTPPKSDGNSSEKISPVEGMSEMVKEGFNQQEPGLFDSQQRSFVRTEAVIRKRKMKMGAVLENLTQLNRSGPILTSESMKAQMESGISGCQSSNDLSCQNLVCDIIIDTTTYHLEIPETISSPKLKTSRKWKRSAREEQSNLLVGRKETGSLSGKRKEVHNLLEKSRVVTKGKISGPSVEVVNLAELEIQTYREL
ncbi:hypothetical protein EZV62_002039 [Acer yangbiense]|uniref:CCHC-type domain-containing protein n=1 Tax=Acer yangbiense TaxID=1000413 RepID=A0A5C7IVX5_9ROSI|nr:hypothetical protein EZV62_002039 [Acer yangbiense]